MCYGKNLCVLEMLQARNKGLVEDVGETESVLGSCYDESNEGRPLN